MYKYSIDDDTTKKVIELANGKSENQNPVAKKLIEEINDFNSNFTSSNLEISRPEYKRMNDIVIDNDQITKQAENELYDYKKASTDEINNNAKATTEKLENNKNSLNENYEKQKKEMDSYYKALKQDISDDALKRGLSRSSIVINLLDAFDKDQIENYNKINNELTANMNDIDAQIANAKLEQEKALSSFDITYAVKLQEKVNKLTKDLLDKQNEVIKYNNEIIEKEKKFEEEYAKMQEDINKNNWNKEKDLLNYAGKYGTNMIEKYKSNQIYNIAKDYLSSIDKNIALSTLQNNTELINLIGQDNYNKLLAELNK